MQKEKKTGQWMAIGKAAKYLGVSRDTLRRWEKKGRLESFRSPTNRRYYTKLQLNQSIKIKNPRQFKKKANSIKIPKWIQLLTIGGLSFFLTIAVLQFILKRFL